MTKKEPKSDARLSEFDWHELFPIFLHYIKVFLKPMKHHLVAINFHRCNRADQILTYERQIVIWFLVI